jgi:hypothetical protein
MGANTENNNVLQDRWPESKEKELGIRTDVEKIILHLQGKLPNTKLSPALEEKLARMKQTAELITKYGGAKKVIALMMDMWDMSFSTARRLFIDTQEAYGDITHFNRQFHIDTYIQMIVEGLNLSKKSADFRSYANLLKEYKAAILDFMGTNESDMYKNLQVPPFVIGFFPEELKTKLPSNWKEKLEKLKTEIKRKDEIEDAIILTPDPETDEEDPL